MTINRMHYKFNKLGFIFSNLPTIVLTIILIMLLPPIYDNPLRYNGSILEFVIELGFVIFPIILFLPILVPSYILGYQYLKYSKNLEINFGQDYVQITDLKLNQTETLKITDIKQVIYIFSSFTRINSHIFVFFSHLILLTNNKRIIVPCFVITKEELLKHLGDFDDLIESDPYIPFIKTNK